MQQSDTVEEQKDSPKGPQVVPENIPVELKEQTRWVGWRKVKCETVFLSCRSGSPVQINDESEFVSFEDALSYYRNGEVEGIAFAADQRYVVLEQVLYQTRNKKDKVMVDRIGSYAEATYWPDKRDFVRVIARASIRPTSQTGTNNYGPRWSFTAGPQFVVVNGWHVEDTPTTIKDNNYELSRLYKKFFGALPLAKPKSQSPVLQLVEVPTPLPAPEVVPSRVIERLRESMRQAEREGRSRWRRPTHAWWPGPR